MNIQIVICPFCGYFTQAVSVVYYVFHQIADFHADFCYLFQIAERTWTPLSTEGDKNKSRKRLHLRCRIGTFLFCFSCIETSTAASSSPARGPAVLTALPSCSLQNFIQRCSQALPRYFYPNLRSSSSRAIAASTCLIKFGRRTTVGNHSTAATNRRSRGVPSALPTARQSQIR